MKKTYAYNRIKSGRVFRLIPFGVDSWDLGLHTFGLDTRGSGLHTFALDSRGSGLHTFALMRMMSIVLTQFQPMRTSME